MRIGLVSEVIVLIVCARAHVQQPIVPVPQGKNQKQGCHDLASA